MSLSLSSLSVTDIVGPLNKMEVQAALLDYEIEKKCFQSWDSIEEMIWGASEDVKRAIYESAVAKKNVESQGWIVELKRRREHLAMTRNVCRRLGEYIQVCYESLVKLRSYDYS